MKEVSFNLLDTRGGYRVVAYCDDKARNYVTRDLRRGKLPYAILLSCPFHSPVFAREGI